MLIFLAARALASRFTFQYDFYEECSVPAGVFSLCWCIPRCRAGSVRVWLICAGVMDLLVPAGTSCGAGGPWGFGCMGRDRDVRHGIGVSANLCIFSIREHA